MPFVPLPLLLLPLSEEEAGDALLSLTMTLAGTHAGRATPRTLAA